MKKVLYNGRMRTLHSGVRGGHYVISSGRKVYLKIKSSSKKTRPKKKTSSALKKKSGPKKKTSPAKRKPAPKKKSKRGFRMPRLFKGGGGNNEDKFQSIYDILDPGITKVMEKYPDIPVINIESIKGEMERLRKEHINWYKKNHTQQEMLDFEREWKPRWEKEKLVAVIHFTIVINRARKTVSEEMKQAIREIATFDYWYNYIHDNK